MAHEIKAKKEVNTVQEIGVLTDTYDMFHSLTIISSDVGMIRYCTFVKDYRYMPYKFMEYFLSFFPSKEDPHIGNL